MGIRAQERALPIIRGHTRNKSRKVRQAISVARSLSQAGQHTVRQANRRRLQSTRRHRQELAGQPPMGNRTSTLHTAICIHDREIGTDHSIIVHEARLEAISHHRHTTRIQMVGTVIRCHRKHQGRVGHGHEVRSTDHQHPWGQGHSHVQCNARPQ